MQEKNACGQDFFEPLAQKLTLDVHAGPTACRLALHARLLVCVCPSRFILS